MRTVTADRETPRPALPAAVMHPAPLRRAPAPQVRLSDAELLMAIGRDIAAVYAEVLHQPLPKRYAALIEDIEANHHTRRVERA